MAEPTPIDIAIKVHRRKGDRREFSAETERGEAALLQVLGRKRVLTLGEAEDAITNLSGRGLWWRDCRNKELTF